MTSEDMSSSHPLEQTVRDFIRNQRDTVERQIEEQLRMRAHRTWHVDVRCHNVLGALAIAPDRTTLVTDALYEIAENYLTKRHPELKLRSVRLVRFFGYYQRTGVDAALVIQRCRPAHT